MTTPTHKTLIDQTEATLRDRFKSQGVNHKTKSAHKREVEFLCGAMTGIGIAIGEPFTPTRWVLCIQTGRSVLDQVPFEG